MKTLFKVLALGIVMTAFSALTFAQEKDLAAYFDQFKTEIKSPCGHREAAIATGKTIIEKFSDDVENVKIIDAVKKRVPVMEAEDPKCKTVEEYNASYKAKDWAKFTSLSKELIAKETDQGVALDLLLTLVSVEYDQVVAKVDSYNNDTLMYAKQAIQKIESGTVSKSGDWGTYNGFKFDKDRKLIDGKSNSLNWLNFMIAYINYYRLGVTDPSKKKDALPYFYKTTQIAGDNKNDLSNYTNIGDYYFDEAAKRDEEYRKIRTANKNVDTDESKAVLGMARGYADRAIDTFARARKVATDTKAKPEIIAALGKKLTDLYKFRFNIAADAKTPDLESYVAALLSKSMPDPSTEITPVVEVEKPVTPTTTSTTPTTTPTTPTNTTTKPATTTKPTTTTKPAATTKQPTSSTTTDSTTEATTEATTKTKTPVKKPVTKKKGTR